MGFEPVLSEEGNVFYNPKLNVQDACLVEVPTCQLFVLIIGGRFGTKYKQTTESITNHEYKEAVKSGVPIFALVEQPVQIEYLIYRRNKDNPNIDVTKISYPSADSVKIFDFMEEVQCNSVNNALAPFSDYAELESYLKQQWAGFMFTFLSQQGESKRVANMLEALTTMSNRLEFLSKQILTTVGTDIDKLNVRIYDYMLQHDCIRVLASVGKKVVPSDIVRAKNFKDLAKGISLKVTEKDSLSVAYGQGYISASKTRFELIENDFEKLKKEVLKILEESNKNPEEFVRASGTT
jgi:hypothetical protein